jgi:peptidoglycan/LPS O-acetylase OafA/YrhL
VTFLRALASLLITNAHYVGVYPTDLIANGGLLGDVIFFAVSGFCLTNIKQPFPKWYAKRFLRIYPQIWVITAIYLLAGLYPLGENTLFFYFAYPTYYHFVGSIMVLYIPYYVITRSDFLKKNFPAIAAAIAGIQLMIYVFWYDKSFYHIDTVRSPMIWFLFFASMLLGGYFRVNAEHFINRVRKRDRLIAAGFAVLYFGTKMLFSRYAAASAWQIINQWVLFALLYFLFKCFAGIDQKLTALPQKIKTVTEFLSKRTLEIYLVQYPLIPLLAGVAPFPLNWFAITAAILISAYLLRFVSDGVGVLTRKWGLQ